MSHRRATAATLDPVTSPPLTTLEDLETPFPVATILFHPMLGRIGEYVRLTEGGAPTVIGRDSPLFRADDRNAGRSLDDPCLSRRQLEVSHTNAGFSVRALPEGKRPLRVRMPDGAVADPDDPTPLPPGSVICIGDRLMLGLCMRRLLPPGAERLSLSGESLPMRVVKRQLLNAIGRRLPILLLGETGTGKERVARQIMALACQEPGLRRIVDCSTIAPTLIESTLFGHVRGAFTDATKDRTGEFMLANHGCLFLDEIGELPEVLQPKLLRAIQEGEATPLGAERPQKFDVRVIAATNRPMDEMLAAGSFRRDLYSRLAALTIQLPPLRHRREDIPALFVEFLRGDPKSGALSRLFWSEVDPDAPPPMPLAFMECLYFHDWSDNVRGLRNAAHQVVTANLQAPAGFYVPDERGPWTTPTPPSSVTTDTKRTTSPPIQPFPRRPSHAEVRRLLESAAWDPGVAASRIGRQRTTVLGWMDAAGMRRPKDVPDDEVAAVLAACRGDMTAAAARLEISLGGLRQRMRIDPSQSVVDA